MKWTSLNDIREKYLAFFESKGHLRLPSFPLIPINDRSLLLINSGMAPMKKYFTGEEEPPRNRVTTCQKCIRTPDLERVGHTARHGTFFEMLGNFSFGDYFKNEAIPWAWEFLTEVMEIPAELLWPSVYEEDEEAFKLWRDVIGVPEERIVKLGKADNFWEHGTGPCGPCSEIYFDRGEKYGCGKPDCKPGCDCDRYMEIWNNVFSQFNNNGDGTYSELAQKNIDTGMGLERLACVMQGVDNMFEVDTVRAIIDKVCAISGKKYGDNAKDDISIRVITDHTRSAMFMICDGVTPSNEGRGYVLRRIIRRACRHGKLLGINHAFLVDVVGVAIRESCGAYPELAERSDYIRKLLSIEEERFDATIDAGLSILTDLIENAIHDHVDVISGEEVFKLYDTFGFPIELTREITSESKIGIDEEDFARLMEAQKLRARGARNNAGGWSEASKTIVSELPKTEFTGYTDYRSEAKIIAIIVDDVSVPTVSEGAATIILDRTPFYGEGGGQVGDTGTIYTGKNLMNVSDTKKTDGVYLHFCTVVGGIFSVGDKVTADISDMRRRATARNHSAAHLLQAALRKVLGNHVAQAGSYVSDDVCRFDFSHFAPMTKSEISQVEALVNEYILAAREIVTTETDPETAKKMGAMALFGEKYGKVVRVVKMADFSTELCGGTHCSNTGEIGLFKIISESGIAAGVRRIEAVTARGVLKLINEKETLISGAASAMKVKNFAELPHKAASLTAELASAKKEIDELNAKLAATKTDSLLANAIDVASIKLVCAKLDGMGVDAARALADSIRNAQENAVAVFAINGEKLSFVSACGKGAVAKGAHAGKLVSAVAAVTGGKGGGRPDSAMAGGNDASKIDAALSLAAEALASQIAK